MKNNQLMFGFVGCPNCTCWQSTLFKKNWLLKFKRCECCGKIFVVKRDKFHESKVKI